MHRSGDTSRDEWGGRILIRFFPFATYFAQAIGTHLELQAQPLEHVRRGGVFLTSWKCAGEQVRSLALQAVLTEWVYVSVPLRFP